MPVTAPSPSGAAWPRIAARIARHGPIPFRAFQEEALYGPEGFYTGGGGPGRRSDFLTSPEVGSLFGAVIARALDEWWAALGEPDPYVVVECGAGPGALAAGVLSAAPACLPALRYVLVDRSPAMRAAQAARLPLVPAASVLGGFHEDDPDLGPVSRARQGPLVASLEEMPSSRFCGVVLANELLDNLPVDLYERTLEGWAEVRVAEAGPVLVPATVPAERHCRALAPDAPLGARIPLQAAAAQWQRDARAVLEAGRVVAFDYADSTAAMAARPWYDWLRTYRRHGPGLDPWQAVGEQDITCAVALDQLPPPARHRSQAEFLRAHGIEDLVTEGRRIWHERAAIGDLVAVKARSRVTEAEALTDPAGLGRLRVLEWVA